MDEWENNITLSHKLSNIIWSFSVFVQIFFLFLFPKSIHPKYPVTRRSSYMPFPCLLSSCHDAVAFPIITCKEPQFPFFPKALSVTLRWYGICGGGYANSFPFLPTGCVPLLKSQSEEEPIPALRIRGQLGFVPFRSGSSVESVYCTFLDSLDHRARELGPALSFRPALFPWPPPS